MQSNNLKHGFTLAEVLITLGIIGVIATLTTPALTKNTGQAKIGPSLAKFVDSFESATSALLMDEDVESLNDISGSFTASLKNHLLMSQLDAESIAAYTVNGYTKSNHLDDILRLKDGTLLIIDDVFKNTQIADDVDKCLSFNGRAVSWECRITGLCCSVLPCRRTDPADSRRCFLPCDQERLIIKNTK